jgi:monovalent cation:H+ antiporter, CPA1 family
MDLSVFLAVVASLLLVVGLLQPVATRLRVPLSVVLAVVGITLGITATFFLQTTMTDRFDGISRAILELPIGSEVFLYIFLPTLLFQTALTLDARRMLDDVVPILVMAVLAVIIATMVIGVALAPFASQSLLVCLIVASIVATTDPSAVVGIFRDIGAPGRLGRLVEGESLLNDAAAITLFSVFMAVLMTGEPIRWGETAIGFVWTLTGGALFGFVAGRVATLLFNVIRGSRLAQMSTSLAMPYIVFIACEDIIGVSGVIAVVVLGLTLNIYGPSKASPDNWKYIKDTWDQLAFWASSLVFVLAAILVPRMLNNLNPGDLFLILVVVVAALIARAIVLFGLLPLLCMARLSPRVSVPYRLVIMWGGLRGAVTLALAFSVTENPFIAGDIKRFVAILATGFVLFTLLVQGTTMRAVIRYFGLDKLSPLDQALRNQIIAVALQNVREAVTSAAKSYKLTPGIIDSELDAYSRKVDTAAHVAETSEKILERDKITLGLVTLAGRERDLILEHFRQRTISLGLVDRLLTNASRLIDRTRAGGRTEYLRAARGGLQFSWRFRFALILHRRLRGLGFLPDLIADRFESMLATRIIAEELQGFIDEKIVPILGGRVGEILQEVLARRRETIEQALEALRLQYPGYAEELEKRFLRKLTLRREELEYEILSSDGLIGPELHASLRGEIERARSTADKRPQLDLALHIRDVVTTFPLFAGFDERQRDVLMEMLVPVFAEPGEKIITRGDDAEAVFFIASGAVEVNAAGRKIRLGRGDFFGEMALLSQRPRRSDVQAIGYCSLLCLSAEDFRSFLASYPGLRDQIRRVAGSRLHENESAIQEGHQLQNNT